MNKRTITYISYRRSTTAYLSLSLSLYIYIYIYIYKLIILILVQLYQDCGNAFMCGARDGVFRQLECVQIQAARVE